MIRKPGDLLGRHPFAGAGRAGKAACRSGDLCCLRGRTDSRTTTNRGPTARPVHGNRLMPYVHPAPRLRAATALPLIAALAMPAAGHAQVASEPTPAGITAVTLDPVVISGGFSPVEADAYGRAATVITAEELEQRGTATVQDALRGLPGVSITATGVSAGSIRIRGGNPNHTLVLIDGVNAAGGDQPYTFSGLDLADVERIEVLRGPQSIYYGSAAASGVVNIITRKADRTGGRAMIEGGNGAAGALSYATVTDRLRMQVDAGYREDRSSDVSKGDPGDRDGLRRATLAFSGDWQATDDLKLGFATRHAEERYWYDATNFAATSARDYLRDADYWADRRERINTVWGELATLDGRLTHRLSWQETRNEVDSHDDFPVDSEGRREALKYRATYGLDAPVADARQTVAMAYDHIKDRASGGSDWNLETDSVALEYRGAFDNGLDVQLGLRRDDNSTVADQTTWAAGLSWQIAGTPYRLHASAGTGVVNPQYYQLLGGYGTVGNPNLVPEENRSVDLGLEYRLPDGRGLIDVTWFRDRLENAIEYSGAPLPDGSNYRNIDGTSRREGVEVAAQYEVTDALSLRGAYTYLDARNPDDSPATRRPRHELGLTATLKTFGGRGWVSADLRHVADMTSEQYWGTYANARMPDFTVVNMAASYDLTDSARLTGRITNFFDAEYQEAWGYTAPGRAAWIGIEQRF